MESLLSDFDSMSESSSSDDQEDMESLYGGQARTIFSSLEETIEKIDDFLLFERGFLHNDIVCMASDPLGLQGKVIDVDMTVDVENIYGCKISDINTRDLQKIRSISVADYVILGAWIGKVERVIDCLTILLDNGTKCQLSAEGPEKITPTSPDLIDDPHYPFYPGLRVQVEYMSTSAPTRWLCGNRKDRKEQGTVCNVDAGLVYVDWLCCALNGSKKIPVPLGFQDSKSLTVLPCFPHTNWQLGDWCSLPAKQSFPSAIVSQMVKGHDQSDATVQTWEGGPNFRQTAVIIKTKTKVDVLWQDGSLSMALDSHLLLPINVVDGHDFWPEMFVLEKGTGTLDDSQKKWGIIRTADPKERTVQVRWCNLLPEPCKSEETDIEEIVSAYELVEHPDYSYSLGEVVLKADEGLLELKNGNNATGDTVSKIHMREEAAPEDGENGGDQSENLKSKYLSYFGTVVGFKHGQVEVKWADCATSKVAPCEIFRVDKCESSTASVLGEENNQQPNEELPVKNQLLGQKLMGESDLHCDNTMESILPSISQVAKGLFTRIASSLFGSAHTSLISRYQCTSVDAQGHSQTPEEEAVELSNLNLGGQLLAVDDSELPERIIPQKIEEVEHLDSFRQFDMVNNCFDHHFFHQSGINLQSPQLKRGWMKKVHQEWSIFQKDLPESLYVRVYEERMDLVRTAILGSDGTPYHDGVFFFDIYLPPQYPNEPPMVFYNSGGLRLNPNLYESGKVCLSLLNTWSGSQSEVWNPSSSTILQVLLSLQALVLNEKPYFNEAGFDAQIGRAEGEKNSFSYNENAFLVNCRSMLYILRKPPKHFEALVDEHFSRRSKKILSACKAYVKGAPVGHPFNHGNDEQGIQEGCSTGFKIMLTKLYPKLVEAFSEKGFICGDVSDQVL
ncbi:probable ubiquitin-conjugating enzyme E2 24 [Andrographis paniculata]|uniref:probable ubiquitin-conjugating enzyme E2 24 n=1 Tax=Andrographis paniculata TaxID=175694 RepID=UPI0021E7B7D1|nr:probable ubiquitin-conjugating enzyme E2 24 [Andrographis paniculata]